MIAPPTNSHLSRHARDCDTWVEYQHMQSLLDPQEVVEDCEGMYEEAYGNVVKRDRDGLVLSDLQQDLVKMSNQPSIRYVYRRFVIIKLNTDVHGRPGEEDWVSCRNARFHFRVVNLLIIPSASGNWSQGSRLGTKLIPRVTRGTYNRYIMCMMLPRDCSPVLSDSRTGLVTWASTGCLDESDPASRSEQRAYAFLNGASTSAPFLCQALRRPNNHSHSFEPWPTDCRLKFRTSYPPPLPQPHHPPTTRSTSMTSSMNTLQIITRAQPTKPSPFSPQLSPMPQHPNTVVVHRSLSATRASPPFPTNPSGTIPRLHPHLLLLGRNRHGRFGKRSCSLPQNAHDGSNQPSNPDPPGLTVLSALRTDRGRSDQRRPGNRRRTARTLSSGGSRPGQRHGSSIQKDERLPRNFRSCTVRQPPSHQPPGLTRTFAAYFRWSWLWMLYTTGIPSKFSASRECSPTAPPTDPHTNTPFRAFNVSFMIYSIIQIAEIREIGGALSDQTGISDIPINVLTTIIPCVIAAAELAYIGLGWKIYTEFGWQVYKFLGADRQIKKMYAQFQVFECLVKFDVFFWVAFCVQLIWLVLQKQDWEYYVTVAALPLSIIVLVEGNLAARHENKWMMYTFISGCFGALVYFVYKVRAS